MTTDASSHPATDIEATIRRFRRRYRKSLERCKEKFSENAVHDLRVRTRRTLALLELLRGFVPQIPIEKLRRIFENRLKAFGELRDAHVQEQLLKPLWSQFPEARALKAVLERRKEKLTARLARDIRTMESSKFKRRLKDLEETFSAKRKTEPALEMKANAARVLEKAFRNVSALQHRVRAAQPATIHQWRIAFKRFRYLSELLRPILPGITDSRLERMKRLQESAGEVQDLEALLVRIAHSVKRRRISPVNVRNLRNELQRRKSAATESFMKRLPELNSFKPGMTATKSHRTRYETLHS